MTEMGLPAGRIVMLPGDASLGYGIEYEYSIMERIRLAALQGDAMLSRPVIAVVGEQAWKAKEARLTAAEMPEWGDAAKRGPAWEAATAAVFLQSGADIVALLHPDAVRSTQRMIAELVGTSA
jgi:acetyl-CoA decarbonylase/synthase complex subunit delta